MYDQGFTLLHFVWELGTKALLDKPKLVVCEAQCGFKIWKTVCEKTLTPKQVETLVKKGKTGIIKGFKSKAGKNFDAALILQDKVTGATRFEFQSRNNTDTSFARTYKALKIAKIMFYPQDVR